MKVLIEVELEFRSGKFKSKEEVAEALCDQNVANAGDIEVDDSVYEVIDAQPYCP